jgi:hypothetical protein
VSCQVDATDMPSLRPSFALSAARTAAVLAVLAGATATDAGNGSAVAQGRLEARYSLHLGSLPFGYGTWLVDVR